MKLKDGFKGEQSVVLPQAIVGMMSSDPLASALYLTDIGYYPKARHHYRRRTEPIEQYVFIYCVDGEGWYEVDGVSRIIHAGEYFILPKDKPHIYAADEKNPWSIYWIHFSGTLAQYYASGCMQPTRVEPGDFSRISVRNNLFDEILITLNRSYALENIRYAMALLQHYFASLRYIQQFRGAAASERVGFDIAESAIHYFEERIGSRLSLEEAAAYVGLSASRFSAVFKERTGHSPLNYFNLLKVRKACGLLDDTQLSVSQISLRLGIEDQYYFSRLFSRIMGMSPRAYRTRERT